MIRVRRAADRGHFDHGWLDTWHTFSFGDYYDPHQMGFRALRVINDDRVAPGAGFGMHGHRDMEIVTVVLNGALAHRDSLGHGEVLRPGEVQHMTAGTGIRHAEFNPSADAPVHLYQIWLLPDRPGLAPSYAQRAFDAAGRRGRWQRLAAPDGADGALTIHQDASIHRATLEAGQALPYALEPGRHAWVQVLDGAITLGGESLATGDGAAVSEESRLDIRAERPSDVLLFDLA
jgi:redox-sensitive bicupin YhaK (pirin superfamily)